MKWMLHKTCQIGRLGCHNRHCLPHTLLVCIKRNWFFLVLFFSSSFFFFAEWQHSLTLSTAWFVRVKRHNIGIDGRLTAQSKSHFHLFYPQLKWPSHYFQLFWAVLSAADLAEKEQNRGAWGDQTRCLLHRKHLQSHIYILTFFLPSDLSAQIVGMFSFLKTSADYSHEVR